MRSAAAAVEPVSSKNDTPHAAEPTRLTRKPKPPKGRGFLKVVIVLAVLGAAGGGLYAAVGPEKLRKTFDKSVEFVKDQVVTKPAPVAEPRPMIERKPFTGLVRVTEIEQKAEGFRIIPVEPQDQPLLIELSGTTDYDQNTLNKIIPRFDKVVIDKVYVEVGEAVEMGKPLIDLRSIDLATAKNECRTAYVQWDHDHKYLIAREPLAKEGRITQIIWTDTQNDEKKSRLDYLVARGKLATYGLTNEQIDKLLEGLTDDRNKAIQAVNMTEDDSKMTIYSKIDGVVVDRQVVSGNFYDSNDVLLTISPLDDLWVYGNVFESDQDKVHIGQKWEIILPNSTADKFEGTVKSIANGVDVDTRTLRIRGSIPNPGKNLKARMLVRAILHVKPLPTDTTIPRNALSVTNGEFYAFVQKGPSGEDATLFERRKLEIEQENTDNVIVKKGLKVGDRVVSNGSLMLAQMYEDQSLVDTGMPVR
jgi:cobalt-zinc-cadmium efflux system membrane fusion protein